MSSGRFFGVRKMAFFVCLAGALRRVGDTFLLAEIQKLQKMDFASRLDTSSVAPIYLRRSGLD